VQGPAAARLGGCACARARARRRRAAAAAAAAARARAPAGRAPPRAVAAPLGCLSCSSRNATSMPTQRPPKAMMHTQQQAPLGLNSLLPELLATIVSSSGGSLADLGSVALTSRNCNAAVQAVLASAELRHMFIQQLASHVIVPGFDAVIVPGDAVIVPGFDAGEPARLLLLAALKPLLPACEAPPMIPVLDPRVRFYCFDKSWEYGINAQSSFCAALTCVSRTGLASGSEDILIGIQTDEWCDAGWGWDEPPDDMWRMDREISIWWRRPEAHPRKICRIVLAKTRSSEDGTARFFANLRGRAFQQDSKKEATFCIDEDMFKLLRSALAISPEVKSESLVRLWLAVACCSTTAPIETADAMQMLRCRSEEQRTQNFQKARKKEGKGWLPLDCQDGMKVFPAEPQMCLSSQPLHALHGVIEALDEDFRPFSSADRHTPFTKKSLGVKAMADSLFMYTGHTSNANRKFKIVVEKWGAGDLSAQLFCNNRYMLLDTSNN
jgi:hypothetical protein